MDDGILARPPIRYVTPIGSDSYAIAFPIVVQPLLLLFDIYIGRRSATIRTALLSLLCTRRFFTCEMMSNRIPPLQTATVLEFQLSGSKGLRLKKKQETRGKFFNHGERSASQLASRFDSVY